MTSVSTAEVPDTTMREPGVPSALLLLADGRFPAGGHAHSGGVEAAVAGVELPELVLLRGRAAAGGLVGPGEHGGIPLGEPLRPGLEHDDAGERASENG